MTLKQHAYLYDATRCIDCRACLVACSVENRVPMNHTRIWVHDLGVQVCVVVGGGNLVRGTGIPAMGMRGDGPGMHGGGPGMGMMMQGRGLERMLDSVNATLSPATGLPAGSVTVARITDLLWPSAVSTVRVADIFMVYCSPRRAAAPPTAAGRRPSPPAGRPALRAAT